MDILKSTPKSLKNVNVHPDGRWEIPAAIISINIDDSTSIPTDSGPSSSEPTSHGTDNGPIYVIDDDDDDDEDKDNRDGSDSSYDTALADLSMEAKEDEVNGSRSRNNYESSGRQESQSVSRYPLTTISPTPASNLLHSYESFRYQRVPEKSQFMDLTLCSSDDVIDLTSDNENENQDQDQDEDDEESEEELNPHRRKRAFIQPDNDPYNEINDITLTTNDITLTNNSSNGIIGSDPVKCRRVSIKHDNKRIADSLSTVSNNSEPSDAIMQDSTQQRNSCPAGTASTSAMLPKDSRQAVQGHIHPYHTSDLQSTLPPTTHSTTPVFSFSPPERHLSPTNGDLTLPQFELAPFMISSLDSIMEGLSGNSGVPGVSESAIPSWPAYDPTFVSPYIPYSLGIQSNGNRGEDGYQDQTGLHSNFEQGEGFEVDGSVDDDGDGSEERPSKRPYTTSGVPSSSSSSHLSPELDHETEVRLKSVLKQYLATPDIFL